MAWHSWFIALLWYQKGLSCPLLHYKFSCFLLYNCFAFIFYQREVLLKLDDFFFDYEKIKAGYTRDSKVLIFPKKNFERSANFDGLKGKNAHQKEVVIKLLSNINASSTQRCLNYILREDSQDEDICLKNEFGEKINPKNILSSWGLSEDKNNKECWHLMFSIKESKTKENFEKLENAMLETMRENFPNHSFIYTAHFHQNNPHIHIILKKRNNLTHKKIHFKNKGEIKTFFSKMRDDFSMALNYKSLSYTSTLKLQRLDQLLKNQEENLKHSPMQDVDRYANVLLEQINLIESDRKKANDKIEKLKLQQKEIREFLAAQKKEAKNEAFFNKIKEVKTINTRLTKYYDFLHSLKKKEKQLSKEYLVFSTKTKLQISENTNILQILAFLDKKMGKNRLNKKLFERLESIKINYQEKNNHLENYDSKLFSLYKKNLNTFKLSNMLEEQKPFNNPAIEEILINEISNRSRFLQTQLSKIAKTANPKTILFLKSELEVARKILQVNKVSNDSVNGITDYHLNANIQSQEKNSLAQSKNNTHNKSKYQR